MTKVYIVGGDANIERMFLVHGIEATSSISECDFACFTGGADVTPSLYDEKNVASGNDWLRDVREMADFAELQELGRPCVGICRGGQFLNVMNGGKMWQDVNNHAIMGHHQITVFEGIQQHHYEVTSTHHQMMRAGEDGQTIGIANLATRFAHDGDDKPNVGYDTEIVWYAEKKCLCFQPHPEYNTSKQDDTERLFFMLLDGYGFFFDDNQAG